MKFQALNTPDKRLSPLVTAKPSCGCSVAESLSAREAAPPFVTGYIRAKTGDMPVVSTILSSRDKWETVKARMSTFRMSFSVKPGLYAVGAPDENSDVFVTANYKMSFDAVRSSLNGLNAWIMVLDTKGINVWCAAGKGTFGTGELLNRISRTKLAENVLHRKIILPQLGAPGVNSGEVRRKSGFSVMYGPVRAEDLRKYVENGHKCDAEMRRVRFDIIDRLILTPIEIRQIFAKFHYFALVVLVVFGLTPDGIIFRDSIMKGYFFLAAGLLAVFAGAFFTPVFLPFIPFRAFALKGWVAGIVLFGGVLYFTGTFVSCNIFLIISAMILFPLLSSYIALQFTGASTYTSLSGVKKELKIAFPVYISGAVLSFIFLIFYKISDWGML
ncbi:MAG TPA: mercury methylation corrinoid protein HgcA [Spirochaetota bacterium]|nr:mercury methylation corrinoid protein HgcA [Spirochaetota bacterium]HPS86850.1 mercury methylation corrinoid protein HgcA [Spirochaetota bacterium]